MNYDISISLVVYTLVGTDRMVGYYADVDTDGTVDGVIYVDLMYEATGSPWAGDESYTDRGYYSWTTITSTTAKNYYISQLTYSDDFGDMAVISPVDGDTGDDRFYAMTLDNLTSSQQSSTYFCWYNSIGTLSSSVNMSDWESTTSTDFGAGLKNTTTMVEKWNNYDYGDHNKGSYLFSSYVDLWGVLQESANQHYLDDEWFIPSSAEWAAFGGELELTGNNYSSYGLSGRYWTSSQSSSSQVYRATFEWGGYIGDGAYTICYARLSTVF